MEHGIQEKDKAILGIWLKTVMTKCRGFVKQQRSESRQCLHRHTKTQHRPVSTVVFAMGIICNTLEQPQHIYLLSMNILTVCSLIMIPRVNAI